MSCCKEYAQSISEYLDGALSEKEQQLLLEHMESCEGCRAYLGELAAMRDALAELPEAELPEGFHEGVMEKVRAKRNAKKTVLWKRYATVAACAAFVLLGTMRLMPAFEAGSAAPEMAAGGADMAVQMEEGAMVAEAPAAAKNQSRAIEDAVEECKEYSCVLDAEPAETEALSLPVVRGENARETLLSLGAEESGELLLVPVEVLENLPEGLTLEGEFDASEQVVLVLIEEVAS